MFKIENCDLKKMWKSLNIHIQNVQNMFSKVLEYPKKFLDSNIAFFYDLFICTSNFEAIQ